MLNKVPAVTIAFWVIKIMSTTVGETGADYLAVHVGLGTAITGGLMTLFLLAALFLQMRAQRYVSWRYWLTVVLVSVVGTQITDALTDKLEISLYVSTVVFAVLLAAALAIWYAVERTLSIHSITTTRREGFYWTAILFTFALGTAAGDLAAEALGLGFNVGVVVFSAMIAVIYVAFRLGANAVLTFWLAYILTRPLGASLGDLLSQSPIYGGLGLGTMVTSVAFLAVIVVLVAMLAFGTIGAKQRKSFDPHPLHPTLEKDHHAPTQDRQTARPALAPGLSACRRRHLRDCNYAGGCRHCQARRSDAVPDDCGRHVGVGRQGGPRGRQDPDQGSGDVVGRRGGWVEAASGVGMAHRRQGD